MMEIVLATNNQKKVDEIIAKLGDSSINWKKLSEAGIKVELPETHETLEENALEKAAYVYENTGLNALADDSGLEVEALNGAPGVYSARYAGVHGDAEANMAKLLGELKGIENRKACFKTVLALILNGNKFEFKGEIWGQITENKRGTAGFGYDPIFIPDGYDKTFAEMSPEEKNSISHRSIAVQKLVDFLKTL
ncbi:MAG TPA: RdgB/HAM1 family non-canonical purine NTP pyrophosphatase [Bacteroidia bacterium]